MGFGFKNKNNSTPVESKNSVPKKDVNKMRVSVLPLIPSNILHYTDYKEDYTMHCWIADNIEDPDVEPIIVCIDNPVMSFKDSINRVLKTITNSELPADYVENSQSSKATSSLEVDIL